MNNNNQKSKKGNFDTLNPSVAVSGNPEMPATFEQNPLSESQEYGYEKLKQIEKAAETNPSIESGIEKVERSSERNQNQSQTAPSSQPTKQVPIYASNPRVTQASYFGYNISKKMMSNLKSIKNSNGKGDPNSSQTWIFMLVDRMLKKGN